MSQIPKHQSDARKRLKTTVNQMVPAVLTALVATALGFIALYNSPVPMIQDFGKMLTIGMIISFIVGVFLLIPLLYIRDGFFRKARSSKYQAVRTESKMEILLRRFTNIIGKFKWVILIIAIVAAGVGVSLDLDATAETDVESFMPQDSEALTNIEYIRDVLGSTDQVSIVYEGEDVLSEMTLDWVSDLGEKLEKEFSNEVVTIQSVPTVLSSFAENDVSGATYGRDALDPLPEDLRNRLVNPSLTKGVLHIGIEKLATEDLEIFIEDLEDFVEEERIGSVETMITGQSVLDLEMVSALTSGRYQMTLLGMALVFLGLFAFYRHPVKAILPLFPIVLIVGWSGLAVAILGIEYTPLTATLGALIIGIGTEFTILLMERYYEERKKGELNMRAITIANQKVGKAILASALTTLGGFSALLFSDFEILSNFGMMTLINIALAVVSTLIVLPALLMVLGRWINADSAS